MDYTVVEIKGDGTSKNGQKYWKATIKDEKGKAYDVFIFKKHLKVGDKLKGELKQREYNGKNYWSFKVEKEPQPNYLKEILNELREIKEIIKNAKS